MTKANEQTPATSNLAQTAEQLSDELWRMTRQWDEFAKSTVGLPLIHAVDGLGMQLALSAGAKTVKAHLQHMGNARQSLVPASYWVQCAGRRSLVSQAQADALKAQMVELAKRMDQHAKTVVKASRKKLAEQETKEPAKPAPNATTGTPRKKSTAH